MTPIKKKPMKIIDKNPYVMNDVQKILGEISYLGTFTTHGEYPPRNWYTSWNPDRSKGHKDFASLANVGGGIFVTGMEYDEMKPWLVVDAVRCEDCGNVIYSSYRHNMEQCECGKCMVDGGRDYFRRSLAGIGGKLNLLTGEFKSN